MNLKELIKEVEKFKSNLESGGGCCCSQCQDDRSKFETIKQTVEVVQPFLYLFFRVDVGHPEFIQDKKDWQKLKGLLGLK